MDKAKDVPREEVSHFATIMEARLREHDDRPGWTGESFRYLIFRLNEELNELYACFSHPVLMDGEVEPIADPEKIIFEAADVANFAMMIADNLRAARREPEQLPTDDDRIEYPDDHLCDKCEGKGWIWSHGRKMPCKKCRKRREERE